ncbi:MAG: carbon-nitrogen hydrolase family protein [Hydrogenophaga sp.]
MPSRFVIAAAQTTPMAGDRAANLRQHLQMVEVSALHGVQLLLFPELSLSGYEPALLNRCLTSAQDPLLTPFYEAAQRHAMTLVVGAPTAPAAASRAEALPHISALVIGPQGGAKVYHKQHLHPGEDSCASAGPVDPFVFDVSGLRCGLAICADVAQAAHPRAARQAGAALYLAAMVVSEQGYAVDAGLLKSHAITHQMPVLLANMGSPSGGFQCAGRSAFWDEEGRCIVALPADGAGLVVVERCDSAWKGLALKTGVT